MFRWFNQRVALPVSSLGCPEEATLLASLTLVRATIIHVAEMNAPLKALHRVLLTVRFSIWSTILLWKAIKLVGCLVMLTSAPPPYANLTHRNYMVG